jgi:hypothetical protein
MKSFTRWLFFVAIASMIALFPLQAQEHGEKGDKGKNGQGVKDEHKDGKKDEHKDGKKDEHKDEKKDEHKDGKKDGCDDEATSFTVTLTVMDISGTVLATAPSQNIASTAGGTFSVQGLSSLVIFSSGLVGTATLGTATLDYMTGFLTVTVTGVGSAVDIVIIVSGGVS